MKKLISIVMILAAFLSMTTVCFAGSIPEDLLSDDNAKLYIGRVDGRTTLAESTLPYEENKVIYIDVTPTIKYKGNVEIGVSERHTKHNFGSFIPEKDKEYLFGYLNENNFYIYEIKARDEKSIKLVDSDKHDMTKRLEDYLNDGAFAMAEQERSTLGQQISFAEFLYKKPSLSSSGVDKVTLRYQDELYEVDKDKFFKIAEDIMITNVKNDILYDTKQNPNSTDAYKTNLYIELLDVDDHLVYFGAVSRFGEVDHYGLFMSRLMNRDYEMKKEDLSRLYSFLPADVQKNIVIPEGVSSNEPLELPDMPEYTYTVWIVGVVTIFTIAFVSGFIVKKRRK